MGHQNGPSFVGLARNGVVTRPQLLAAGFSPEAIKHAVRSDRLFPWCPGVYAAGTPHLTKVGIWSAAVLSCGVGAGLSHSHATALLGIGTAAAGRIEVSVPRSSHPRGDRIRAHRRHEFELTTKYGIPVTTPACTIIDMAARLTRDGIEAMVGEADLLGLITPAALRTAATVHPYRRGAARLIAILDRRTFRVTRSKLERLFIPIAVRAGYPIPLTRQWVNGYEVDFYWPDLRLVVESDGLTYHRTPAQQAKDRVRDQTHTAAGLVALRFTHEQIAYDEAHVERILAATLPGLLRGREI
jgi:very-short-patch-repair endonuclease